MKIVFGKQLEGYTQPANIEEFNTLVCDGEASEIILYNTIDSMSYTEGINFLDIAIKKLCNNGKIVLSGLDLHEMARELYFYRITDEDTNNLLFANKHSGYTMAFLIQLLQHKYRLEITLKKYQNLNYIIEAVRHV